MVLDSPHTGHDALHGTVGGRASKAHFAGGELSARVCPSAGNTDIFFDDFTEELPILVLDEDEVPFVERDL